MFRKTKHLILLTRPVNVIITMMAVGVIGWMIPGDPALDYGQLIVLAALSAGMIAAGANAGNDAIDADIDRINRPGRPIPAGKVTVQEARYVWITLTSAGIILSIGINPVCAAMAVLTSVFLYLYNRYLKRTPIWGNLAVSLITGLALVYTGAALHAVQHTVVPALFAFLIHFAREIVKDMEDMEGDRIHGARTFPVRFGLRSSVAFASLLLAALLILIPAAAVMYDYPALFLYITVAGVFPLVIGSVILMWIRHGKKTFSLVSLILKICMVIGIAAFLFSW